MQGLYAILMVVGFFVGTMVGSGWDAEEMRNKVVLYCIEKPDLCKTEYNNIKTQQKLNDYQKPEL